MRIVLFLFCVLAFLAGVVILVGAQSAIHEIEAFMFFLISAVFLIGASVVEAINMASKKIAALAQILADVRKTAPPVQPTPTTPPQPVASEAPASRPYFFSVDGKNSGPHSLEEMRWFHKSGKLTDETLVIRQGDAEWQPAIMFPEIFFEG